MSYCCGHKRQTTTIISYWKMCCKSRKLSESDYFIKLRTALSAFSKDWTLTIPRISLVTLTIPQKADIHSNMQSKLQNWGWIAKCLYGAFKSPFLLLSVQDMYSTCIYYPVYWSLQCKYGSIHSFYLSITVTLKHNIIQFINAVPSAISRPQKTEYTWN